ncbi:MULTISPECIES: phospholipase D-like domain-containing protein [Burkholderia]|uniref:phospholipase D n=1 Tax=Burkholderia pyrrocinia TaxID=60550 RepID=A0A318IEC8_BURPY|nr:MULTISPECIES: phospholipase D-like domain-containing protein [Burkholderia]PXX28695.1 phosphatidylserine/phosphatidylglycerophosphate/cardiolipin synthase-like enzyme [Burkholderia pyrrocinia]SFW84219.1 Phosphatidylserine/phosphatidylglycerophosphate/cardiolipin synthase [Burkholderia sp. NFACC33-1]SFY45120.1 Phosphatidylserine/phosphatidylglycerophosphate/cardiolipin synthase [Burkholderia sp. NFPP32]
MTVSVRSYLSPTLVLLAFDWSDAQSRNDFLGFAIRRTPGFWSADGKTRAPNSWLPNRLTFDGPAADTQGDAPTDQAPIQKFMWWDARIDPQDRDASFRYDVYPVVGTPDDLHVLDAQAGVCDVVLPAHIEDGIGTWFNRAVVSSQAFAKQVAALGLAPNAAPSDAQALKLRTWLANDMEQVFAEMLDRASRAASAVYHLTDTLWALPAFEAFGRKHGGASLAIVYDAHTTARKGKPPLPSPNQPAVDALQGLATLAPRGKTHIMHDKFIVTDAPSNPAPARVLTGSANFTTEGLTEQANVLHAFDSPALAALYNDRAHALAGNPSIADTARLSPGWSAPMTIGSAQVRLAFSPEPPGQRTEIDTIVAAIAAAKHSVSFCLFMPTDAALRDACFAAGDRGLMMFGLVNKINIGSATKADAARQGGQTLDAATLANLELYHRSRDNHDVIDAEYFSPATVPQGFEPELRQFPGEPAPAYPPVVIHHKFIVIDAEGANPVVYTGSANMSRNSEQYNDENLLEIRDKRIAAIYLAEFLRLYEHYRARALAISAKQRGTSTGTGTHARLALAPDSSWAKKYYVAGSPEEKARIALASTAPTD